MPAGSRGLLLLGILAAPCGEAAATVETAKLYTEDAPTAGRGVLELELAAGYLREDIRFEEPGNPGARGDARTWLWELALGYGLTDRIDVSLGASWEDLAEDGGDPSAGSGFGDIGVAVKWNFLHRVGWDLSYVTGMTLPTGDEGDAEDLGPGQGLTTLDQLLVATLARELWNMSVDAGFSVPINDNRNGQRASWLADIGSGWQLRACCQLLGELSYRRDEAEDTPDAEILAATLGVTWQMSSAARLDVGASHGIWGDEASATKALRVNVLVNF